MFRSNRIKPLAMLAVLLFPCVAQVSAADLDPKAITIKLPADIKWTVNPSSSESAVLATASYLIQLDVVFKMQSLCH